MTSRQRHRGWTRGLGSTGLLIFVTAAVVAGQSAGAVNPTLARAIDQERGLDVKTLVALALDHSPDIAIANAMIARASGQELQAGLRSNPEASVERREQVGGMDAATIVGFNWALDLGRIQPRRDAATADRHATEWDREETRRLLTSAIREAYGEVLAAARVLTTTEAQIETGSSILRLATERASAGSGAVLERDQAAVEVSLLTRQRYRAELRLEAGRLALAQVVGLGPSEPLSIRGTLERAVEDATRPDTPPVVREAARSDIRAATLRLEAAFARGRSARADGRLNVGVFGEYMSMKSGFPQRAFSDQGTLVPVAAQFHTVAAGVSVMLPWFNRQQGTVSAATADALVAARQVDRIRLAADYQIALSRLRVEKAKAAAILLRDDALTRARANVEVLREAYGLGSRTLSEVLAEVRRVQQIEIEYSDALLEWYQASVALRTALGEAN